MKMQVITYDVWGNARDGWEANQAFTTGIYIDVTENCSDMAINRRLGVRGLRWNGELEFGLYAENRRNGKPELELRPIGDGA